jgi:hypothetical protein
MKIAIVLIMFSTLFLECERIDTQVGTPDCINEKISSILSEGVWNPPAKIYSYIYNGQTVYYIPARCCDIPSTLYDQNCKIICHPDGGFSGMGDGKCNDFFSSRSDGQLVWEDPRD